jgi:hypothetical protein
LIETTLFTPLIFIFQEKFSSDPFFFDERIAFVHRGCIPGRTHFPSAARPVFDIHACNTDYSIHSGPQAAPCGRLTSGPAASQLDKEVIQCVWTVRTSGF